MKINLILLFLIVQLSSVFSQTLQPPPNYTGEWSVIDYPNGQASAKGNYINGKKSGLWTYYYEKGEVMAKEKYVDGKIVGESICYFPDGKIQRRTVVNGTTLGTTSYFENGQIEISSISENGKHNGEWCRYFENGVVMVKGKYANGIMEGEWINHYENGKLSWVGVYKNNVLLKETFYDEHGNIKVK